MTSKDLKHFSKAKTKRFTFMIVPNSTGRVITFRLPYWLMLSIAISTSIIIIGAFSFYGTFIKTSNELHTTKEDMAVICEVNKEQSTEIEFLRNRTMEIEEKLISLNELENEVLCMVGLSPESRSSNNEPVYIVSRSDQRSFLNLRNDEYEEDIIRLDTLIEEQEQNMQKLIDKVEKQITYLESIPDKMPTNGKISSPYGYRNSPFNSRIKEFHQGIDISNRSGTSIYAAGSGIVTFSGYKGGYGYMIIISHGNGYTSVYAHNSRHIVSEGDKVSKGDLIAKMGSTGRSTGPHLHFEIRMNGEHIDPASILK